MLIGVLSDTHGDLVRTAQAVAVFRRHGVERVLHCGDIGSPRVVDLLAEWPAYYVFGNVDDPETLGDAIRRAGQQCLDWFGSIELEGIQIALLHGHEERRFRETVRSGRWQLVCHGHTHVAAQSTVGTSVVLNPGALHRTKQPAVAIVELPKITVQAVPLYGAGE